jgi:nicotinamide mononucleotide transporter
MTPLEIIAIIITILSVILAVRIKVSQYPIGIIGTILYFFVFWKVQLYASAWLQVYFTIIQFYGWWYWLKGDKGNEPKITNWNWKIIIYVTLIGLIFSYGVSEIIGKYTDAKMAFLDSLIFGLSVVAQFFLDRKKMQHWFFWGSVNILSIIVYFSQGLTFSAILYCGLLYNVFIGYRVWKKELNSYV